MRPALLAALEPLLPLGRRLVAAAGGRLSPVEADPASELNMLVLCLSIAAARQPGARGKSLGELTAELQRILELAMSGKILDDDMVRRVRAVSREIELEIEELGGDANGPPP